MSFECCNIDYVNSLPGAGKTEWAVKEIITYLNAYRQFSKNLVDYAFKENKKGIDFNEAAIDYTKKVISKDNYDLLIFVAPTHNLLQEVKTRVISELEEQIAKSSSEDEKKILYALTEKLYIIDTKSLDQYNANGLSIYKTLQYLSLNYAKKSYMNDDDSIKLISDEVKKLPKAIRYEPGSVVFITQQAFWTANHSITTNRTFWNRCRTRVIIDEARSCDITTTQVKLTEKALSILQDKVNVSSFNNYKKVPLSIFNAQLLKDLSIYLEPSQLSKLNIFLKDKGNTSSIFVKMSLPSRNKEGHMTSNCSLFFIQIPYAALYGWHSITLMSAFFIESQLYAILSSAKNIENLEYKIKLNDITYKVINQARLKQLQRRFESAKFTYIFENEATAISKRLYRSGIVVSSSKKTSSLCEQDAIEILEKATLDFNDLKNNDEADFGSYSNISALAQSGYVNNNIIVAGKEEFFRKHKNVKNMHPIDVAIRRSIQLSKSFLERIKLKVNFDDEETVTDSIKKSLIISLPKTIGLSEIDKDVFGRIVPDRLKNYFNELMIDARGLNKYKDYSIISVLSAYNLDPITKAWFEQYCIEELLDSSGKLTGEYAVYDAYKDFSLGQCIQTIMRCSIRDAYNTDRNLVIVSTRKMALDLIRTLRLDEKKSLINPSSLLPNKYKLVLCHSKVDPKHYSEEYKSKLKENAKARSKLYRNSANFEEKERSRLLKQTDIDLMKEAFIKKYYYESDDYRKYKSLNALICTHKKTIKLLEKSNSLYNDIVKEKDKLNELLNAVQLLKPKLKSLNLSVKDDFKKWKNDPNILEHLKEDIEFVKERRQKKIDKLSDKIKKKQQEREIL